MDGILLWRPHVYQQENDGKVLSRLRLSTGGPEITTEGFWNSLHIWDYSLMGKVTFEEIKSV